MSFALLRIHQNLPEGVHPYPTLKGQRRFDTLLTFNAVIGAYVAIHKLAMPLVVWMLQDAPNRGPLDIGVWYLYHIVLGGLLSAYFRKPSMPYLMSYIGWFGVGYLPLTLVSTLLGEGGQVVVDWNAISGILCYGGSLIFTFFLLYRLRMPTTAYLYGLEERLIPKLHYAVPYALFGVGLSLFHFL